MGPFLGPFGLWVSILGSKTSWGQFGALLGLEFQNPSPVWVGFRLGPLNFENFQKFSENFQKFSENFQNFAYFSKIFFFSKNFRENYTFSRKFSDFPKIFEKMRLFKTGDGFWETGFGGFAGLPPCLGGKTGAGDTFSIFEKFLASKIFKISLKFFKILIFGNLSLSNFGISKIWNFGNLAKPNF